MEKHLFFPSATEWMWNYCIYLGSFIGMNGGKYDLGIYIDNRDEDIEVSAAIVFGNTPGDYYSGDLNRFGLRGDPDEHDQIYEETRKRAENLGLYTPNLKERKTYKFYKQ
jgi:hypothetical protein